MPLYEYVCMKCGAEFEKLAMRACDKAEMFCPVCRGRELEEKISSFASVSKADASGGAVSCAPAGG